MRDSSPQGHPLSAPTRITVVSGLPRSGTSLVMQILEAAGLPMAVDAARPPDPDNPKGYFELAAVTRIRRDASFLEACVGRVVKIVAPLLIELPARYAYRVVFVERDLGEVLASQRAMLERRGDVSLAASAGAADQAVAQAFRSALDRCRAWLERSPSIPALTVDHRELTDSPSDSVARIARFLAETGGEAPGPDPVWATANTRAAMLRVVDPSLYHSRSGS